MALLFAFLVEATAKTPLTKEKAFAAMFPLEQKYDDHKVRLASSLLLQLIEDFWAMEDAKADDNKNKRVAAREYRLRKLDKHFVRVFQEATHHLDNQALKNANFHLQQYELQMEAHRFDSATRKESEYLQPISDNLDSAYCSLKLRQACLASNYQTVYNAVHTQSMIPEIMAHIERAQLEKVPSVGVYYFAFKSLTAPDETAYFVSFKTLLFEHGAAFPADEIRDLYLIALNYCIKKHNSGEADFLKTEFELYREGLKNKALYINNFITKFTYRNVVTLALTLQEYAWAEQFIERYKNDLEPAQREGNYKYCLARLEYERKNYDKVLILLQQADYEEILITLAAKALLLKMLYETNAYDALEAHLEAMRTYIKRKSKIAYHQENYLNLLKFTKRLLLLVPSEREHIAYLKTEIQTTKALAERKWLLEKVEKMG
ncbi:MAG: hypothetical protein RLZZ292_679 [Bacteroidota bacterium]